MISCGGVKQNKTGRICVLTITPGSDSRGVCICEGTSGRQIRVPDRGMDCFLRKRIVYYSNIAVY